MGEVEDRQSVKSSKVIRYVHRQSSIRLPRSTRKHQMPKCIDIIYETRRRENLRTLISWSKHKPFEQQSTSNSRKPHVKQGTQHIIEKLYRK